MILLGMAWLQAKYKFDPGILYIAAFLIDMAFIGGILE